MSSVSIDRVPYFEEPAATAVTFQVDDSVNQRFACPSQPRRSCRSCGEQNRTRSNEVFLAFGVREELFDDWAVTRFRGADSVFTRQLHLLPSKEGTALDARKLTVLCRDGQEWFEQLFGCQTYLKWIRFVAFPLAQVTVV